PADRIAARPRGERSGLAAARIEAAGRCHCDVPAGAVPGRPLGLRARLGVVPVPRPGPSRAGELLRESRRAGGLPGFAPREAAGAAGSAGPGRLLPGRHAQHGVRPDPAGQGTARPELQRFPGEPSGGGGHPGHGPGDAVLLGAWPPGPEHPVRARGRGPGAAPLGRRRPRGPGLPDRPLDRPAGAAARRRVGRAARRRSESDGTMIEPIPCVRFRTAELSARERYQLLTSLVVPRPIGWISTRSVDGTPNLAPFSYFMAVSPTPFLVAASIGSRAGRPKDTL